jgi:hypothetical protein
MDRVLLVGEDKNLVVKSALEKGVVQSINNKASMCWEHIARSGRDGNPS